MGYSMRTDNHRLTIWEDRKDPAKVHAIEFYDHREDPDESVNLADDRERQGQIQNLRAVLARHRRGWSGDPSARPAGKRAGSDFTGPSVSPPVRPVR